MNTLIVAAATFMGASPVFAQGAPASGPHPHWGYHRAVANLAPGGRCRGISYGTGARSCGSATGGPVGGLTSRN